nr:MAG TPA: hypothetical protein [Crassvirales sp.]
MKSSMKLVFVDHFEKDTVIATVQSDVIPVGGKFINTNVVLKSKRYAVSSVTIDYDTNIAIIEIYY